MTLVTVAGHTHINTYINNFHIYTTYTPTRTDYIPRLKLKPSNVKCKRVLDKLKQSSTIDSVDEPIKLYSTI